ncbi:MAG: hypothetical protein NG747_08925 [Candidatus Brocadia sp.]|nr:hypothetical protein [Candidatus Brocadia sp.]
MRKYFTLVGWFFFVTMLSSIIVTKGYSHGLFETSLTVASSSSYSPGVKAKIEISGIGKVELTIEGLRSTDDQLVNQNSTLIIETEINDTSKTYSKPFNITDGKAELEFTLEGLSKGDKLEIINVSIDKETTSAPTPTPIATVSPIPTNSPIATPTPSSFTHAVTNSIILVPGGIINESTTPTPTPVTSPSPTPVASPTAIPADVEIKPETINLKSNGKFKAFIELDSPYDVNDIVRETIVCEGAPAIDGKVDKKKYIATFNIQDLEVDSNTNTYHSHKNDKKEEVFTVTGKLEDGTGFEGSDMVKVKDKGHGHDDDDDDDDHDDDGHGRMGRH